MWSDLKKKAGQVMKCNPKEKIQKSLTQPAAQLNIESQVDRNLFSFFFASKLV